MPNALWQAKVGKGTGTEAERRFRFGRQMRSVIPIIDPAAVEFPPVMSAALYAYASNVSQLPHYGRILKGNAWQVTAFDSSNLGEIP